MAVALGLSPREIDAIADSEPELLTELVTAVREKWTTTDELLAGLIELTHANYRVLLSLAGAKKSDIPKPLSVPRPGAIEAPTKKKKIAGPAELSAWIQSRNGE